MPSFQAPFQKTLSSPGGFACVPGAILATWVTALGFIVILIGGALHDRATIKRHLDQEVAARVQLAVERSTHLLDQARLVADSPLVLQGAFAKDFDGGFLPDGDFVVLYDLSGRLVASYPASRAASGFIMARAADRGEDLTYMVSPAGEGTHLVGTRHLPRHPFLIAYGKNVDNQITDWRLQTTILALASMAALIVTAMLARGIRRRQALTTQLQKVRDELEVTNSALRTALTATELIAAKDQLTGLWNRRTFDQRLEAAIAHATRHVGVFSLLLIDIDHFKGINDRHGHIVGDEVLRRFAEALHGRLRQNDVAARWGGEEFVILADEATLENACQLGQQIRAAVCATAFPNLMEVTASIGVTSFEAGDTSDTLLNRADQALYAAKRNGRDRVVAADAAGEGRFFFCDPGQGEPSLFG